MSRKYHFVAMLVNRSANGMLLDDTAIWLTSSKPVVQKCNNVFELSHCLLSTGGKGLWDKDRKLMDCTVEGVYEAFHADLKRFVLARVSDSNAAEDVLQDVYMRIHTHIDLVRDCSRLQAWVYQIARHAIVDYYRSRRPMAELPEPLALPEPGCENDVECELMVSLASMIDELPDKYRQALILTLYEGLTQQELADRLGISLSGAKSRVQRAREKLKDSLLDCCHFAFDRYGAVLDYQERCCCCVTGVPGRSEIALVG